MKRIINAFMYVIVEKNFHSGGHGMTKINKAVLYEQLNTREPHVDGIKKLLDIRIFPT